MRKPRITVTQRHTGRIYISMEPGDFEAIVWSLRFRAGVSQTEPAPQTSADSHARLMSAIRRFEERRYEV